MAEAKVAVNLSRGEAIVLVDFLMRFRDKERLAVEHKAEEQLLYDLCAVVENQLPELFDPQWRSLVERARASVVEAPSEW
jgi:hypothetical protein